MDDVMLRLARILGAQRYVPVEPWVVDHVFSRAEQIERAKPSKAASPPKANENLMAEPDTSTPVTSPTSLEGEALLKRAMPASQGAMPPYQAAMPPYDRSSEIENATAWIRQKLNGRTKARATDFADWNGTDSDFKAAKKRLGITSKKIRNQWWWITA
ncbi:hypothetical protein [Tsukamurella tyrosinosolvens]|uniref:hypothetical protein n=1 Tax=Tsukamurella tyrosinosolvens TaxID=57704 RepID=UPI0008383746|nr:hypothetical protein [Tsukamurella tyrosinosolvens]